jgi:hypothetical protein
VAVGQSGEQGLKRIETAADRASDGLKRLGCQAELLRGIRTLGGALEVRIKAEDCRASLQNSGGATRGGRREGVESRLDGDMLVVVILMRFQRRGGRKRIVTSDGSEIVRASRPQPDGTLSRRWRVRTAGSRCWRAVRMVPV